MDRVRVLREAGQLQLAYLTAHTHGMGDEEAVLAQELRAEGGKGVDGGEGGGGGGGGGGATCDCPGVWKGRRCCGRPPRSKRTGRRGRPRRRR